MPFAFVEQAESLERLECAAQAFNQAWSTVFYLVGEAVLEDPELHCMECGLKSDVHKGS